MTIDKDIQLLVVGDYGTMRRILVSSLAQLGFNNVDEADNARSALAKIQHIPYALVIADWPGEGQTGLSLLARMRSLEAFKEIPFMIVTTESKPEQLSAARAAGVNGVLVKPFDAGMLLAKLTEAAGEFA